jgi:ADP-ribosylglycohydrolase
MSPRAVSVEAMPAETRKKERVRPSSWRILHEFYVDEIGYLSIKYAIRLKNCVQTLPIFRIEVRYNCFKENRVSLGGAFTRSLDGNKIDRYLGCMFGIAIGDAIGYIVEFLPLDEIRRRYGPSGIAVLPDDGLYSDDTQMSLATADGLIEAKKGGDPTQLVYREYLRWLRTQRSPSQRRAPGGTCLSALASGRMGTIDHKLNDSKGCGGVMRTAPVGLACAPEAAFRCGVEFAAITHSHPSGYLSAGFFSQLIAHLSTGQHLIESILTCRETLIQHEGHEEVLHKVDQAHHLAEQRLSADIAIPTIGNGWVGEEALGIALFCALRFPNSWKAGTLAAVNHSGDSDSTGSIAGAILGTLLGIDAIPPDWVQRVENSRLLKEKAELLFECYAATRISEVKVPASAFPLAMKCPMCGKPLKVLKAGTYSCPGCKTSFSFDRAGKATIVLRRPE